VVAGYCGAAIVDALPENPDIAVKCQAAIVPARPANCDDVFFPNKVLHCRAQVVAQAPSFSSTDQNFSGYCKPLVLSDMISI